MITSEEAATLQKQLAEAKAALHQLNLGQSVVSLIDQNGEKVTFNAAKPDALAAYIRSLEQQLPGSGVTSYVPPIGYVFL